MIQFTLNFSLIKSIFKAYFNVNSYVIGKKSQVKSHGINLLYFKNNLIFYLSIYI